MRRALAAALCASLLAAAPAAYAAGEDDELAGARTLFNAGAQAYAAGNYPAALQAFEQAYAVAPRPGILFSIAQAHRRQYFLDKRPEHLHKAIALYREYLAKVPKGGRRSDVAQALAELQPIADRLEEPTYPDGSPPPEPPAPAKPATRLMISSQIREATVVVDGAAPAEMPLIEEVAPGKHRVEIRAPGYRADVREVVAVEGSVVALDIDLDEKPALLAITTEERAEISIDGRLVGTAPLQRPLELPAGRHLVTVAKGGRKAFSRELTLGRDDREALAAPLDVTDQRYAAYALFGGGAGGFVLGGVLAGLAFREQALAEEILGQARDPGNVPEDRRQAYTGALEARDDLRRGAAIAAAAGALAGAAGFLLYVTDFPSAGAPPARDAAPRPPRPKPEAEPALEISAAPVLSPGFAGAALSARF